jgi:hypothetical protein
MKNSVCACPHCGSGLDAVMAWARLVTDEPTELTYRIWGLEACWAVGGAEELAVTCPCCGAPSTAGRNCPVARA